MSRVIRCWQKIWSHTRESQEIGHKLIYNVKHVIIELKKKLISPHNLHKHWYTCPIALPVHRNSQHRSLLTVVSATSTPPFQPLRHQRNVFHPVVNRFTRQTLLTVNRKHFFMNGFCIEPFCPQRTHYRTLLLGSTFLRHGRHFDYWNHLWTCACASAP
jgi:hypothetical protein